LLKDDFNFSSHFLYYLVNGLQTEKLEITAKYDSLSATLENSRADIQCHKEDRNLLFITMRDTEDIASSVRINMMHRINLLKNKLGSKIRSLTIKNMSIIELTKELLVMKKSLYDQELKAERVSTSLVDSDESIKLNETQINCLHVELEDCYMAIEESKAAHCVNEENYQSEISRFQHTVLDLTQGLKVMAVKEGGLSERVILLEEELQAAKIDQNKVALILDSLREELLTAENQDKDRVIQLAALENANEMRESFLQVYVCIYNII
jgi:chromosome segregation ATPase